MTISSVVRKAGPFAGNGVATTFPFAFKVFDKTDVKTLLVSATGTSTTLTLDSDYSVVLNANQDTSPGGSILYPITGVPLPAGYSLVLLGDLPYDQETNITNSGGFYPSVIEDMSDRSTIQIQQLAEITSRAIVYNESESTSPVLPTAAARANGVLGFDALGQLEVFPLPASVGAGDLKNESWTNGTDYTAGVSTSVPLSRAYATKANLGTVVMQGIAQDPNTYSLNGLILTFLDDNGNATPIPAGLKRIWCIGGTTLSISVTPDNSVSDAKLLWGPTLRRNFTSIALLRANTDSRFASAFVRSYYGDGANAQGNYDVDSTDTTSTDNGGSIIVDAGNRRWKLDMSGDIDIQKFGARGVATSTAPTVDATAAIQAALNAIPAVRLPAKAFLVAGQVTAPVGGKLIGESDHSTIIPGTGLVSFGVGTIIYVTSTTVAPFLYTSGNTFEGLTFFYPNQLRTLATPIVYPATFSPNPTGGVLTNTLWNKVQSVNAYFFIDCRVGHLDFQFKNIDCTPLLWGIVTDGSGGTDTFINIEMSYYYFCQVTDPAATYMFNNAIGLQIGRSDAVNGKNVFVGSLKVGIRFFLGTINSPFGPYGSIDGLSLDGNQYGLYSECTHPIGVDIANLMSNCTINDIAMPIVGSNSSVIQVTGLRLWGARATNIAVQASNCSLKLSNGDVADYTSVAVQISGPVGCTFTADNVRFTQPGVTPVSIQSALALLNLSGNHFAARPTFFVNPPTYCKVEGNTGFNGVVDTMSIASPLALQNASDLINLTGTGTISAIAGGWTGRRVLLNSTGGALTLGTGGNIQYGTGGGTIAQNRGVELCYDGTNWRPTS